MGLRDEERTDRDPELGLGVGASEGGLSGEGASTLGERGSVPDGDGAGHETRALRALVRARLFHEAAPVRIGRFTVLERLGSGGMGVVWLAHDPELDRRVAVKLLRTATAADDPERASHRLRREAQAMARLRHGNVVAIHEVGEHEGAVYIAMEYVAGMTLGQWLRAHPRRRADILARFVAAGRGMQAAHEAGLVHRDFKPDNVLVGDDGRVCVTDFGLARPVEREADTVADSNSPLSLQGDTRSTTAGELAGTPIYMARECLRTGAATAASDQFAFCVALYQALSGRHPFGEDMMSAVSAVYDGTPAQRPPSDRVPGRIWRLLERGLAHEPSSRHPSLGGLLDALADDPARRWGRRGAGVLALAGAAALSSLVARREPPCRDTGAPLDAVWSDTARDQVQRALLATEKPYAEAAVAGVTARVDAWAQRWRAQATEACEATLVHETRSSDLFDRSSVCLHRNLRALSATLHVLGRADDQIVEHASDLVEGLPDPDGCGDLEALARTAPLPSDPAVRRRLQAIDEALAEAWALHGAGKYAQARERVEPLVTEATEIGEPGTESTAAWQLGEALDQLGDPKAASARFHQALVAALAARADEHAFKAALSLGYVRLWKDGDAAAATESADIAGGLLRSTGSPDARRTELLGLVGEIAMSKDDLSAARAAFEERVRLAESGEADPIRVAAAKLGLGTLEWTAGDYEAALSHDRGAVALFAEALGAEHPDTLRARNNVANILVAMRRLDEAQAEHEAVLAGRTAALGPEHAEVGGSLVGLAGVLYQRDRMDEAIELQRRAMEVLERALGPDHAHTLAARENMGAMLSKVGEDEEALAIARDVLARYERTLGTEHHELAGPLSSIARSLFALGRPGEAAPILERAIALTDEAHPTMAGLLRDRAELRAATGDRPGATADLRRAIAITEARFGTESPRLVPTLRELAATVDATESAEVTARADRIADAQKLHDSSQVSPLQPQQHE